jgi:ATP-binding cassette, subfamily G (WHITE), member 2
MMRAAPTCRVLPYSSDVPIDANLHVQAKRVNIAIALVTQPRVLFLDEPSSGLDSWHANEVLTYVKALTATGITVVATIHSPTAYAFGLFDRLLLLLGGRVAYFGQNGANVVEFFQKQLPEAEGVPEGGNPAEWIVDLTTQADHDGKAAEFGTMYKDSKLGQQSLLELEAVKPQHAALDEDTQKALKVTRATETPSWWAFWVLFKYRTLTDWKNVEYLMPRISDKVLFAFVIFSLFWKLGSGETNGDWGNLAAVLFMWSILPAYGAASYVPTLIMERGLYIRERNDGLYRPITYLAFKLFGEGVLAFVLSLIASTVIWFALELKGLWLIFWLAYLNTLIFGIVLAYFIAALSPTIEVGNTALPAIVTIWLFFVGLFIPFNQIPHYWRWFSYITPLRYAWGALMKNQFGGCCDTPYLNGQSILEYYGLSGINSWVWLTIEFGFTVFCFIGTLLALSYIKHQRR